MEEEVKAAFAAARGTPTPTKDKDTGKPKPKSKKWQVTSYEDIDVVGAKYEVTYEPNPPFVDQFLAEVQPADLLQSGRTDSSRPPFSQRRTNRKLAARVFDHFYSRYDGARANQWVAFNDWIRRGHYRQDTRTSWSLMRVQSRDCFQGQRDVKGLMRSFGFKPGTTREGFLELMARSDEEEKGPKKGALLALAGLDEDGNELAPPPAASKPSTASTSGAAEGVSNGESKPPAASPKPPAAGAGAGKE